MRDSCIFYKSFFESINELEESDQLELYKAIFNYSFFDKEPIFTGIKKTIFILIKPNLAANNQKYKNGTKGGRPKKNNQPETEKKPNKNQNETKKEPKPNQTETETKANDNVNVDVNVDVNVNDNENIPLNPPKGEEERIKNTYSIFDILKVCQEENIIIYERHIKKANNDYRLAQILEETQILYSLEEIKEMLRYSKNTYITLPTYKALDLVWCVGNYKKVMAAEEISTQKKQAEEKPKIILNPEKLKKFQLRI